MRLWTLFERDVRAFHRKFSVPTRERPSQIPEPERRMRIRLIREEADELIEAIEANDPIRVAGEAVDLIYVTIGTLVSFGVRALPVWREVQAANMRKVPAPDGGKIRKPQGWEGPNLANAVIDQIHERRGVPGWVVTVVGVAIGIPVGFLVVNLLQ